MPRIETGRRIYSIVVHGQSASEKVEIRTSRIEIDTRSCANGVLTCLVLEEEEKRLLQTGGRQ
jgi:hypothetical protein